MSAKKNQSALEMLKNNPFKNGGLIHQIQKDKKEGKTIPKNVTYKNTSINSASTESNKTSASLNSINLFENNKANNNNPFLSLPGTKINESGNNSLNRNSIFLPDLMRKSEKEVYGPKFVWSKDYAKGAKESAQQKTQNAKKSADTEDKYIESLVKRADRYFSDREKLEKSTKAYFSGGYSAKSDTDNIRKQYSDMRAEAKELSKQLKENKDSFNEEDYNRIIDWLQSDISGLKKDNSKIGSYNEWLNSFGNENEYNIYNRNSSALSENPTWEELSNRREELEKRRGFYFSKGYNDEVYEIDKDIKWLDEFTAS